MIIRSGVYWRVNRSVLNSTWLNNHCDMGGSGSTLDDRTGPISQGGEKRWLPGSGQPSTNSATDVTYGHHAGRVSQPSGQPDKLVRLRYNSTIQNRTDHATGTWLERIRYADVGPGAPGAPFHPDQECS